MSELNPEVVLDGIPSAHRRSAPEFLAKVLELGAQGYVLHPKPKNLRQSPSFVGRPRGVFVTPERAEEIMNDSVMGKLPVETVVEAVVEPTPDITSDVVTDDEVTVPDVSTNEDQTPAVDATEAVTAMNKKDDLLKFASENDIAIPEDKKAPKAIKQYILNQLKK